MSVTKHAKLHPIEASPIHARRERVFLVMSGVFLGTLVMLNILGITRFIEFGRIGGEDGGSGWVFAVAVGVLPYPVTFLCTDLISELFGRARANAVVWVGLLLNAWVLFILWLAGILPGMDAPPPEELPALLDAMRTAGESGGLTIGERTFDASTVAYMTSQSERPTTFFEVRALAFGATLASMIAYLVAQFTDVWMFHFWKKLTRGRHLWLRNNGSTLVSQLIDTVAVILITAWLGVFDGAGEYQSSPVNFLLQLIVTGYVFKFVCALLDTAPLYWLVPRLARWLDIDPMAEHRHLEDPGPGSDS